MRLILNSRTYQLSSRASSPGGRSARYFAHARTRMLAAEQILNALSQLTGVDETFPGLPAGTLATQLPSPDFGQKFLRVFGKPDRDTACACERAPSADLARVMEIVNGSVVHGKLRHGEGRIRNLAASSRTDEEIVDELYLVEYSRRPNPRERAIARAFLEGAVDRTEAVEDLARTIINSKEFLFQH